MKSIKIGDNKKRLLDLEKMFNPKCQTLDDVLEIHIDFGGIERRFKKMTR